MTTHVVMFSGGVGSWATGKLVAEEYGPENVLLLFADTKMEDEDTYRFLHEAAENIGSELKIIAEGRDPWEVFFDSRFLGNTRIDPCSRVLKREFIRKWLEDTYGSDECVVYLGIDWTEDHRFNRAKPYWEPYKIASPLIDKLMGKDEVHDWADREGLKRQRLYEMGFPHANCGGFCIKAGQAHFANLLKQMPERYAYHEAKEQEIREFLDKDVSILRDRRGGPVKPMTLKMFRERVQEEGLFGYDEHEWGGCGCFSPTDPNEDEGTPVSL